MSGSTRIHDLDAASQGFAYGLLGVLAFSLTLPATVLASLLVIGSVWLTRWSWSPAQGSGQRERGELRLLGGRGFREGV